MNGQDQAEQPRVISATLLRTKTRDILEEARYGGEHFIVETFGKPMAAIVGVEEYWKLTGKGLNEDQILETSPD